jgi:hypothetical protein
VATKELLRKRDGKQKEDAMGMMIIRHKVRDYGQWRPISDEHVEMQRAAGLFNPRISSALIARSAPEPDRPVMFPPGRGRLATCPRPTGSAWVAKTMGIALVTCRATSTSVDEGAKITSTFMRTHQARQPLSASASREERSIPHCFDSKVEGK